MAKGKTEIYDIKYIERGYDDIVTKLSGLGANIMKVYVPEGISAQRAN
ncbi:MAG TPA: UDP-N-acetylglucosamine 1-carboxyvinyltransferase, partial [Bacillota bacterium]|jgi:UDP-N-acetylglucosamine 1-carboxyvinyltransferase|nr:UDP-N-acetylglucosamine 1-carboxyvinyltransferase [Bacillota bacterium]